MATNAFTKGRAKSGFPIFPITKGATIGGSRGQDPLNILIDPQLWTEF